MKEEEKIPLSSQEMPQRKPTLGPNIQQYLQMLQSPIDISENKLITHSISPFRKS
jgi:hypothetical protein